MRKACLDMVYELAKEDPRVCFVGSDLGPGTLNAMKSTMPSRFFMEGVAEQHVVGMAAGLAMEGFIPFVNTIATFITRRCYEQVALDLCLHNLPVRLIGNGGGLVYAPLGPTHLAIEDMAIMRALPNMTVVAVSDAEEMRQFMRQTLDWPQPIYIRLGKGGDPVIAKPDAKFVIGQAVVYRAPDDITILSTGVMTERAMQATETLSAAGLGVGIVHLPTIKPLDNTAVLAAAARARLLVTIEEHVLAGGLGSAVAETLIDAGVTLPRLLRLGIPDAFTKDYGSQDNLLDGLGLQPTALAQSILAAWKQLESA